MLGLAPFKNIGAYGTEIKDHFVVLQALNRELKVETIDLEQ